MIKKYLYLLIFLLLASSVFGQKGNVLFDKIQSKFMESGQNPFSGRRNDSITSSSLYKTDKFNISISQKPIAFDTFHLVIHNPYYTDDPEDYHDNYINYPVSYSVIYGSTLISLFRNGKFVCHNIENMKRDLSFEKILNTKKFKYHWIVNEKLTALAGGEIYTWNNSKWTKLTTTFPLEKQPKLYEDNEFLVFRDCHGEWGGTIYFFDKTSGETFVTESTCANSVFKNNGKYLVLSHLGHGIGSTDIKSIDDPRLLTKAKKTEINKTQNGQALADAGRSKAYQKLLDLHSIQIFSTFQYEEKQLYIIHLNELTFLAEIVGSEIQIVHPLFDNEIYTHRPVTSSYGSYTLISLDFYGTALDKEVSLIIIEGTKIIKIDWNENQSH